ncbi:DUF1795 domain-containing protein [Gandjariella thermophila]|uniref:DUF1795 domain-containing protein n=1 Tax=Gandjariella thermophila TaxID=1931992 RepID=UPI0010F84FE6|nr:DUF1795 domain-containing protein [Gandjariella thermophila]
MASTIPVPIEFSLPEGWRSVPPDEVGAPEAAFVALRPPASQGFTTNITISGEVRGEDIPLTAVADEVLDRLRTGAREVKVGRRSEVGSPANPGLTQAVRMRLDINGRPTDLVQLQVFLGMRDTRDPRRRAVLHIVLTALPDRFDAVVGEFQKFLSTIRPEGVR